ncbi:MAG: hypothetical protein JO022_12230 [Acidobacteriaceae bacterium]|nr:hypothetical protein [Acidobacteriaceae bacterium]
MPVPPVPPPLEQLGRRPFSFYPPIQNVTHNEWLYQKANWSEVLVRNTKSLEEIWVPRCYVGEASFVDEPVMIVGLLKELEYRAGAVLPAERRVIEMPIAVGERPRRPFAPPPPQRLAPVVAIRLESEPIGRVARLALGGVALGIAGCVLLLSFYRGGVLGNKLIYGPVVQSDLGLGAFDDYRSVVRLLGPPLEDRWRPANPGGRDFRLLGYPRQGFYILLMGRTRSEARYIGALDRTWTPVHTVNVPGFGNSAAILRTLPRF